MGIKHLKQQHKEYTICILDFLRILDPSKTGKYLPLLIKELKSYDNDGMGIVIEEIEGIDTSEMNYVNRVIIDTVISMCGGPSAIRDLVRFDKFLERGLIEKKDIHQYKSLGDIEDVVFETQMAIDNKPTKPKQETVYKDDEWLVIKPLNFMSSKKYGAGTKWCTTSKEGSYFYNYSEKGTLLYLIPTEGNDKWALMYEHESKELSWWDVTDNRLDSYQVTVPEELKVKMMEYVFSEEHPNSHYFDVVTKEQSESERFPSLELPDTEFNIDDLINPPPNTRSQSNTAGDELNIDWGRFITTTPYYYPYEVPTNPGTYTSTSTSEWVEKTLGEWRRGESET